MNEADEEGKQDVEYLESIVYNSGSNVDKFIIEEVHCTDMLFSTRSGRKITVTFLC